MRRAKIITAFILGLFSVYLMWKSGEPPAWNPDAVRFHNIGYDDTGAPGSGFWPFWLGAIMMKPSPFFFTRPIAGPITVTAIILILLPGLRLVWRRWRASRVGTGRN